VQEYALALAKRMGDQADVFLTGAMGEASYGGIPVVAFDGDLPDEEEIFAILTHRDNLEQKDYKTVEELVRASVDPEQVILATGLHVPPVGEYDIIQVIVPEVENMEDLEEGYEVD
jgi:hypothetical protein